jgi:hypothetical protein
MANWTIMNVPKALSWSGTAAGIEAATTLGGPAGIGNLVYFPQMETAASDAQIMAGTADPLFGVNLDLDPANAVGTIGKKYVKASLYDLPDMSTPYAGATYATPRAQADALSLALAAVDVTNEYWTAPSIEAETDWVFTMPTRRYNVAVNYAATNTITTSQGAKYFTGATNASISTIGDKDAICVNDVTSFVWDREENTKVSGPVISPGDSAAPFCGEVSVIGFNNAGATATAVVGAKVAIKDLDTEDLVNGWGGLVTPGNLTDPADPATALGLPVLGAAFVKAYNPAAAAGVAGNYGIIWSHRYTRPVTP